MSDLLQRLEIATLEELRAEWRRQKFGEPPQLRSPDLLRRLIGWHIQTATYGSLDRGSRRVLAGKPGGRELSLRPGTVLSRDWEGERHGVQVTQEGYPPLGYDPRDRTLVVNEPEAELIRHIFRRYLELRSVHVLTRELADQAAVSKRWTSSAGNVRGGTPIGRGALVHLLRNRLYLGEIIHKELCHPGQHDGIIEAELFEAVQASLSSRTAQRKVRTGTRAILSGILFDASGRRMSPIHARNRHGQSYRYYTSGSLLTGGKQHGDARRDSAPALEEALLIRLRRWSGRTDASLQELRPMVQRIALNDAHIDVSITVPELEDWSSRIVEPDRSNPEGLILTVRSPLKLKVRGRPDLCDRGGTIIGTPTT